MFIDLLLMVSSVANFTMITCDIYRGHTMVNHEPVVVTVDATAVANTSEGNVVLCGFELEASCILRR